MYMKHGLAFLTGALYADSHAVVKNIMFTVARLQGIDPTLVYLILHEGTDRLEGLFSHVRTQDHSRNFDQLQLLQKLSIAAELVAAFSRQSDLDRGHRRRDVIDVEGVDHINPKSVRQDNKDVGDVDLPLQWALGEREANRLLHKYLEISYDFGADFSHQNCDMIRPCGDSYIGSRWSTDDERSEIGHRDAEDEASKDVTKTSNSYYFSKYKSHIRRRSG
jgi:hypothetical protein